MMYRRERHRPVAGPIAIGLGAVLLFAFAACAGSDERAETDVPDGSSVVPASDAAGDAAVDAPVDADEETCAAGEVCRALAPMPLASITAIAGSSKSDVWASGTSGLLLHWDGAEWTELESPINETLTSLYVTPNEIWGVAGKLALRRGPDPASIRTLRLSDLAAFMAGIVVVPTGEAYVGVQAGWSYFSKLDIEAGYLAPEPEVIHPLTQEPEWYVTPQALHLVPDKALWLVGDRATVARYPVSPASAGGGPIVGQGVLFPVASQADLLAAWGHDEHLWAAGANGTILHFDGSGWHIESTGTSVTLRAIFGSSPSDIWASGDGGTVLHFDGNTWTRVGVGAYRGSLRAIWASGPDDVWFGGESGIFHWGARP